MTTVIVPAIVPARINARRYVRNGRPVDPALANAITDDMNNALLHRGKEVWRYHGALPSTTTGLFTTWSRFLYQSTPYVRDVAVMFTTMRHSTAGYVSMTLVNGAYTGTVQCDTGATPAVSNAFDEVVNTLKIIRDVPADVEVQGTVVVNQSKLLSIVAWEIGPVADTANGFLESGYTTNQNILDTDRSNLITMSNLMVRRGAAHVFNWCVDNVATPRTTTSATFVNIIDATTAVATTSAGFTLDMTNKKRAAETKVSCVFAHYGSVNIGTGGAAHLRDSTGTIIASITGIGTTAQWRTTAFELPATKAKYDVTHLTSANTISTQAVSCFQRTT